MNEQSQVIIKSSLLKAIIDKNDQKRKIARVQLQRIIFMLADRSAAQNIQKIIQLFNQKYICCVDFNRKIVGLQVMPSIISAIHHNSKTLKQFQIKIVNIILSCLNDSEAKIRCIAIKSIFQITRILKSNTARLFNLIFQKMIGCINDGEEIVREASKFLNNTLSGIIRNNHDHEDQFNLAEFVSILKSKLKTLNFSVRIFLIGWIKDIMELNLIIYLPEFLQDLLILSSEQQLLDQAEGCLNSFQTELRQKFHDGSLQRQINVQYVNEIVSILIKVAKNKNPSYTKLKTLQWFKIIFIFFKEQVNIKQPKPHQKLLFKKVILQRFDQILQPILLIMSHEQQQVRRESISSNDLLMDSIRRIGRDELINFVKVIPILKQALSEKKSSNTSEYAINWMKFMLQNYNDKIIPQIKEIIEKLVQKIYQSNVKNVIDFIQNTKLKEEYFQLLIQKMLQYLYERTRDQDKIQFMMKKFVSLKDSYHFCFTLCNQLAKYSSETKQKTRCLKFRSDVASNLNVIIVNQQNLVNIRKKLNKWSQQGYTDLFEMLFKAFKYNPPAAISLCLLAQQYELANKIVATLIGKYQITAGVLMGLCKLVSLLQKPAFLNLRLQILQRQNYHLMECLNSLLMILPQGKLFNILRNRLDSAGLIKINKKVHMMEGQTVANPIQIDKCFQEYTWVHGNHS